MNTDKLIDILQKTELPEQVPLSFKNGLRRQLLNSDHFQKATIRRNPIKYITSAGITAAATALIILYIMTPPTFSSANELLDHIESAYDKAAGSGQMHYLRTLFKRMSGRIPIEEEEWAYDHSRQFSVKTRNALTGEILGHTIIRDGKTYSRSNEPLKFRFNIEEKMNPPADQNKKATREIKDLRVLVIPLVEDTRTAQVYIFDDAWTPESFAKQTPLEIIKSLKSDSLVSYAGRETAANGRLYEILEVHQSKDLYLFRINADQKPNEIIPRLLNRIEKGEIREFEKIDVQETIKIDIDANKIYQIIHSVRQNSRAIEQMELTFIEEKYLDYDSTAFDVMHHGLKEVLRNE